MEFLKLQDLTKKYQGKILAVDKMNLDIRKGEFLVLLDHLAVVKLLLCE